MRWCAASWDYCRWPNDTATRLWTTPQPPRSNSTSTNIVSAVAIYLERRPPLTLRQVDPLIRELTQYRDLINLRIQEQEHS